MLFISLIAEIRFKKSSLMNGKRITGYSRFSFHIIQSKIIDFGGGFVMDDYIMSYQLYKIGNQFNQVSQFPTM
jgi:hypothetical protein